MDLPYTEKKKMNEDEILNCSDKCKLREFITSGLYYRIQ